MQQRRLRGVTVTMKIAQGERLRVASSRLLRAALMKPELVAMTLALALVFPWNALGQEPSPSPAPGQSSDADIPEALGAIERADGYSDLLAAIERYGPAIGSARTVELIDAALRDRNLDDNQRGLLALERQLSIDVRLRGAVTAARLLSLRLLAGYALLADSPQQLAEVLEKFAPLAKTITPQMVREALDTPGNSWPPALVPLMEQLATDWPVRGSLPAAMRMAEAAVGQPGPAPPAPEPGGVPSLAGHWRSTTILFDQPRDEHLVLRPDGMAETWVVTAGSRTPVTRGSWRAQGSGLAVDWADGRQWGQPFTFYQGQLVFPNVPNRRQFWERVE